jgi:hypothetical protein
MMIIYKEMSDIIMNQINLPSYPKAFIETAQRYREGNRVFVAMPFNANHSDILWKVIKSVCEIRELKVCRADKLNKPYQIFIDILDEMERAGIIIADLTDLNPNVLYELGIAHTRCESVIILCQKNQELPFDLASFRCIFYDFSNPPTGQIDLSYKLGNMIDELNKVGTPTIIESSLERTKLIISDCDKLASMSDKELKKEAIWFSGGLSAFAISLEEPYPKDEKEYQEALIKEKEALLNLARRGCCIKCIITSANPNPAKNNYIYYRINYLLEFLEKNDDPALRNIEWVVSPYRQKNLYIIGHISCFEGFRKSLQRGFDLTFRQTGYEAITANISLYSILFERFKVYTFSTYCEQPTHDYRILMQPAIIKYLRQKLQEIN